ncbi:hypothetical protein RHOSPDRAFT_33082 [Rhodotorula sp. JG-1b]|nr:hypothetical protein RHOSPDRAFT_33082 [Rhodotorula sp. JG-1b]
MLGRPWAIGRLSTFYCGQKSSNKVVGLDRAASASKRPSGFSSVESILEELEQIGRERFKVKGGRYHLPPGVIQRVIDMVENPATPNTPLERGGTARRPRSSIKRGSSGAEVQVASEVGGVARRASTSNASAPAPQGVSGTLMRAPPTIRQRRSGSLGSAHSGYQSNVGDATVHAFPPSSSYMNPLGGGGGGGGGGGVGPVPAFRFGVRAPSSSCSTRSWLTATRPISAPGAVARGEGTPPPPFLLRPPLPASSARPMSALAASADRMSIHHLTSSRMRARSPPRFEMPKRANKYHTSVPTSALRHRSTATSFGPVAAAYTRPAPAAVADVASHTRKPKT